MSGLRLTSTDVDTMLLSWEEHPDPVLEMCRDWLDMQARLGALQAVVEAAGPWPMLRYAGTGHFQCLHCWVSGMGEEGIDHADNCAGVALANALTAMEEE